MLHLVPRPHPPPPSLVHRYSEQLWVIDGSQSIESGIIASYTTTTMEICLSTGTHTLKLIDTYGDGWTSGSYVSIVETQTGLPVLDNAVLETGYDTTYTFWVGDLPLHPPSPPRDPPGVVKHEMCHLLIRGVRDPSAHACLRSGHGARILGMLLRPSH